jgi:hypothetical protein
MSRVPHPRYVLRCRRRQTVSAASLGPLRYARCVPPPLCPPPPQPRRWPPLSPVARAPCTTPPVRPMSPPPSPRSGFNLTAEQRPATAISRIQGTSTPSLNFQPNFSVLPPKETSRHSFDSPSSPLGTEAYQLTPGNVGNIASKSDTTQETQTHPPS